MMFALAADYWAGEGLMCKVPIDYKEYPPDWPEISKRIRFERAQNKCECTGECNQHVGPCGAVNYEPHPVTGSKVVLTVAHWPDSNKYNVAEDNLHAWCQRCHLGADIKRHVRNRKYGRHHDRERQLRLDL